MKELIQYELFLQLIQLHCPHSAVFWTCGLLSKEKSLSKLIQPAQEHTVTADGSASSQRQSFGEFNNWADRGMIE